MAITRNDALIPDMLKKFATKQSVINYLAEGPFHPSWAGEDVPEGHPDYLPRLLAKACFCGDVEVSKCILSMTVNHRYADLAGRTALHHAAAGGSADIINLLLECRATDGSAVFDIDARDFRCWTPLLIAVCKDHVRVVQVLLDNGARTDLTYPHNCSPCRTSGTHSSIIHFGAIRGTQLLMETILKHECHFRVKEGRCLTEGPEASRPLLQRDADGRVALHYACARPQGSYHMVRYLLRACSLAATVTDRHGRSPLHVAALKGEVEQVNLLLLHDANPLAQDCWLMNPFHLAFTAGNDTCAKVLAAAIRDRSAPDGVDEVDPGQFSCYFAVSAAPYMLPNTERRLLNLWALSVGACEAERQFLARVIWEVGLELSMDLMGFTTRAVQEKPTKTTDRGHPTWFTALLQCLREAVRDNRLSHTSWAFIRAPQLERARVARARRRRKAVT